MRNPVELNNRKRGENDGNYSAARNSKRRLSKGNPIAVPQNPPHVSLKVVSKMKYKSESLHNNGTSSRLMEGQRNHYHHHHHRNHYELPPPPPPAVAPIRNIPTRRSSTRIHSKKTRGTTEVIEIDSDNEETKQEKETNHPIVNIKKRRMIQRDSDEEEDKEEREKDERKRIVAERLNKERREAESKARERARITENERQNAIAKQQAKQDYYTAKEKTTEQIKDYISSTISSTLMASNLAIKSSQETFINPRRRKLITRNPYQERFPSNNVPSITQSVAAVNGLFDLPTTVTSSSSSLLFPDDYQKTYNEIIDDEEITMEPIESQSHSPPPSPISSPPPRLPSPPPPRLPSPPPPRLPSPPPPELPHDPIDDITNQPIGSDHHLLTYPFEGKKSVTVYERDLDRLNQDQFINDTLVDVFPKIWADECDATDIHTFSSFFYTKLAGDGSHVNYDKIGRWTTNVNIFEKKLIIIPVAQHNHWYLVVVTNPGSCIMKDEGSPGVRPGRKRRNVPLGGKLDYKKPYIMILDSLGGGKSETSKNICEYLKKEAMHKLNIQQDEFIEPEFVSTFCPNQKNFVDCGVFCLHYIKSLYQDPDFMMQVLYNNLRDDIRWDRENNLPNFRHILKRILKKKMLKYVEYLTRKLNQEDNKSLSPNK